METKRTQFLQIVGNLWLVLDLGINFILLGLSFVLIVFDKVFTSISKHVEKKDSIPAMAMVAKGY